MKRKLSKLSIFGLLALIAMTVFLAVSVVAQPPQGQPPQPPPEAIAACQGLRQGSTCEITTPQGKIPGNCQEMEQQLVCVPKDGPPGGPPGGPEGQPPSR